MVRTSEIRETIRTLGLSGSVVCAHASLRSFGGLENGAQTVIDAFLADGCTLVVPTFAHEIFGVSAPPDMRPDRNGVDYLEGTDWFAPHDRVYDPSSNAIADSMGALPKAVLHQPSRVRGNHPISSFSAIGPLASDVIAGQHPLDIYAPLAAVAERGGWIVQMGVGLTRMTMIHLAEKRSGRNLFRRWARAPDGTTQMAEAGSCSEGFDNLGPVLDPLRAEARVGQSDWRAYPAAAALDAVTEAIRRDQRITHCGNECIRCDHTVAGGPIL